MPKPARGYILELGMSLIPIADRTKNEQYVLTSRISQRSSREMALLQKRMSSWRIIDCRGTITTTVTTTTTTAAAAATTTTSILLLLPLLLHTGILLLLAFVKPAYL